MAVSVLIRETVPSGSNSVPDPRDAAAWEHYIRQVQTAAEGRIHEEVDRLKQASILDADGRILPETLPQDMAPGSDTSTNTG